ncbi:hypothetical protein RJ639_036288 [Escallonia herrerae]|uniref:GAG-pre-integrase domain-containing protein n=1 Tax=Escallonia herrerae TaxID=1293975 RepID=A0AA88WSV9_9ASTE|nr:hypothetical protein RJ639_036288 [Escallonia herrerae]
MQVARARPNALVVDGKIYVMGCLVYSKREEIDPHTWAEFLDPTVGCWKLLSSSQVEPIFSILRGPTSVFNIRSFAVGQQEVLLSSECGACMYDVVDDSVREMALDDDWTSFTGENFAYDTDQKLQSNVPVMGLNASVNRRQYCEHWEDYSAPDCLLRPEGLSKDSSNVNSGNDHLYLLCLGERIRGGFFAVLCIKIEISKGTDIQSAPQIHACVKSSTSYKFPGDPDIHGGLLLVHRDRQRLVQFLMALIDDFESVRASLLHRSPFPTLEAAISDLLYEETRLGSLKSQRIDAVLATSASRPFKGIFQILVRSGPGHYLEDCPKNPTKQATSHRPQSTQSAFKYGSNSATITTDSPIENSISTSQISISEIADILKQVLSNTGNPHSTALSTISGNSSRFFDSGCCNHMTSHPTIFSSKSEITNSPVIHTTDGSHMHASHNGHVSTSTLTLSDTYFIPNLTLNLISVGQLCELGLDLHFTSSGCSVQDPRTGQILGIGHKVGRLYELTNLCIPSKFSSKYYSAASTSSKTPMELWHSRLGHLSFNRLRSLVSSGQLGAVKN